MVLGTGSKVPAQCQSCLVFAESKRPWLVGTLLAKLHHRSNTLVKHLKHCVLHEWRKAAARDKVSQLALACLGSLALCFWGLCVLARHAALHSQPACLRHTSAP